MEPIDRHTLPLLRWEQLPLPLMLSCNPVQYHVSPLPSHHIEQLGKNPPHIPYPSDLTPCPNPVNALPTEIESPSMRRNESRLQKARLTRVKRDIRISERLRAEAQLQQNETGVSILENRVEDLISKVIEKYPSFVIPSSKPIAKNEFNIPSQWEAQVHVTRCTHWLLSLQLHHYATSRTLNFKHWSFASRKHDAYVTACIQSFAYYLIDMLLF